MGGGPCLVDVVCCAIGQRAAVGNNREPRAIEDHFHAALSNIPRPPCTQIALRLSSPRLSREFVPFSSSLRDTRRRGEGGWLLKERRAVGHKNGAVRAGLGFMRRVRGHTFLGCGLFAWCPRGWRHVAFGLGGLRNGHGRHFRFPI